MDHVRMDQAGMDRVRVVHETLRRRLAAAELPRHSSPSSNLSPDDARALFRAQCVSRALDIQSREMQKEGYGYYTIGSSGHEGMAAVAYAVRPDDIAFLHYRDAAFQIARADQVPGHPVERNMVLSFACSSEDPISGGRHKVLGSRALMIPPQTSTIASHLPKAVGMAYAIGVTRLKGSTCRPAHQLVPAGAIAICSFGDASFNHSTAQGAINTAIWTASHSARLPLLFICEDNGIGISTKTPPGWVEASMKGRPGIRYFSANGLDLFDTHNVSGQAAEYVRETAKPAFLHLKMVRLYGHAGSDMAMGYLSKEEVEQDEANDPLLHSAALLAQAGVLRAEDALGIYDETLGRIDRIAQEVRTRPTLKTADEVMASLVPPRRACAPVKAPDKVQRMALFAGELDAMEIPQPLSRHLNWALHDLMLHHDEIHLMGEDIGKKGGVYGVTRKLQSRFGAGRVVDTLLDEQSILGLAIGMAHNGFIPIAEIQFLAYLHNAEDQLRGEAATLSFFSSGQFTNPMVIRIAGLPYQRGFGGHFHNDNSIAVLRDIPGVIIACPSNGPDAARMLREAVRLAREEQRIVVFLEPIALYGMRDLVEEKDGGWLGVYPKPDEHLPPGTVGVYGQGTDLAIVTYGNGVYLSRRAQRMLEAEGIKTRIIDMRWLAPLPDREILLHAGSCATTLIVDECRRTASQSEGVMTLLLEAGLRHVSRLCAEDSFIATGPAYAAPLPSCDTIIEAARAAIRITERAPAGTPARTTAGTPVKARQ